MMMSPIFVSISGPNQARFKTKKTYAYSGLERRTRCARTVDAPKKSASDCKQPVQSFASLFATIDFRAGAPDTAIAFLLNAGCTN